jgi:molybdopterin-guanine dinucleotide biosynthesis protein A
MEIPEMKELPIVPEGFASGEGVYDGVCVKLPAIRPDTPGVMNAPAPASLPDSRITGVVLAGGLARRMGGRDKGLIECAGRPLTAYALDALRVVAPRVLVNANRHLEEYGCFGAPVIPDASGDFSGPLAGMLAALRAAETPYVLVIPCDCPLLRGAWLNRLIERRDKENAQIAVAHDGMRLNPVFALLDRHLEPDLAAYLARGERKIDLWMQRHRLAVVDYSDHPELFLNANTPEELAELESRCSTPSK